MDPIEGILKKIAAGTSKENSASTSNTEPRARSRDLPGDPNCPICHGIGLIHQDLPIDDPNLRTPSR